MYTYDSYLPASDDEKSTKPSVLALVVLDALDATFGHREVLVLCSLLQICLLLHLLQILRHLGFRVISILFLHSCLPFVHYF